MLSQQKKTFLKTQLLYLINGITAPSHSYVGKYMKAKSVHMFNSRTAMAGAIISLLLVFTTRRGVLVFLRFLRLEEEYWFSSGFLSGSTIRPDAVLT